MIEPELPTGRRPLWAFGLVLALLTAVLVVVLLRPDKVERDEKPVKESIVQEVSRWAPADSEFLLHIRVPQVIRSNLLPLVGIQGAEMFEKLALKPKVKSFLRQSGIRLERGKTLLLTGRLQKPSSIGVYYAGRVEHDVVRQAFQSQFDSEKVGDDDDVRWVGEGMALALREPLLFGDSSFVEPALRSQSFLRDVPAVSKVLNALGRHGDLTALASGHLLPKLRKSVLGLTPEAPQAIEWVAATLHIQGPPKLRIAAVLPTPAHATRLAEWVETALSLGAGAATFMDGGGPFLELIERTSVTHDARVMRVVVDLPMSHVPALVRAVRKFL